ncbi:MAG: glycosyl transferase [Flavobacteriaceae bacterium]|jgi:hypothetical protein|nr:glycosyl transferase [Flavobacteriaceae bacterium]
MIPKIIHYCWFGDQEMPAFQKQCIASWYKHLPEYQLMFWNQDNFEVSAYPFAAEAYQAKKYAFVSDVCRLVVLKQYGGIYLDTDIELLSSLNTFLKHSAFIGFEESCKLQTGLIGSAVAGRWIEEILELYKERRFILLDGRYNTTTNVDLVTDWMEQKGIVLNNEYQEVADYFALYPSDFFCAKSHIDGSITPTVNTVAIHHFSGSWLEKKERRARDVRQFLRRVVGTNRYFRVKKALFFWRKEP